MQICGPEGMRSQIVGDVDGGVSAAATAWDNMAFESSGIQVQHNVNGKQFEDPEKHTIQNPEEWTASSCWGPAPVRGRWGPRDTPRGVGRHISVSISSLALMPETVAKQGRQASNADDQKEQLRGK
ncbi:uncharacterized protein N7469_008365 [Penicillium citrinum]|uniref:Uncharacterized protein n=1 Tax=Penicillium citrinum TaxID=5077 RepID=A0A9W9NRK3_PENCI|nr:uncharacterized protein N7469_008365 [Penicillium citrinum]KAJ5224862.1 hypothetical protein N7469_008365 [Penicillium citrinum]